jgi:hypothetical protein
MRASGTLLAAVLLLAVSSVQARELLQECPIFRCKQDISFGGELISRLHSRGASMLNSFRWLLQALVAVSWRIK